MWTRQRKQRKTGRLIVPSLAAVLITYFGFHAYSGDYGIYARYRLEARSGDLQAELDRLRAERIALESRAMLLQDGTLEKDMLDEQARRALNVSNPDELTVMRAAFGN